GARIGPLRHRPVTALSSGRNANRRCGWRGAACASREQGLANDVMSQSASLSVWAPPPPRELLRWPLPHQGALGRVVVRMLALLGSRQVLAISGLEHIQPVRDPFILVLNHSTMIESLIVPALLVLSRDGRLIHFLADWNYRLIPGVGLIYKRA